LERHFGETGKDTTDEVASAVSSVIKERNIQSGGSAKSAGKGAPTRGWGGRTYAQQCLLDYLNKSQEKGGLVKKIEESESWKTERENTQKMGLP